MKLLLVLQLFTTLFMVGLIWFVQIVHYPLFNRVGESQFREYESRHQRLTTYVVMPVMLIELGTAILLAGAGITSGSHLCLDRLALLAVVWVSTWALQVPAHQTLQSGFADEPYRRLIASNWIRTIAWTVRGVLVLLIVVRKIPAESLS